MALPLPDVDFTQQIVIAVFQGTTPDPCHDISITKLVETKERLKVHVREKVPGNRCACVGVIGNPFHIIEAARTDKEIGFRMREKTIDCE